MPLHFQSSGSTSSVPSAALRHQTCGTSTRPDQTPSPLFPSFLTVTAICPDLKEYNLAQTTGPGFQRSCGERKSESAASSPERAQPPTLKHRNAGERGGCEGVVSLGKIVMECEFVAPFNCFLHSRIRPQAPERNLVFLGKTLAAPELPVHVDDIHKCLRTVPLAKRFANPESDAHTSFSS